MRFFFLEVTKNTNRSSVVVKVPKRATAREVTIAACNKFRTKPSKCAIFSFGRALGPEEVVPEGGAAWLVYDNEVYQGPSAEESDIDREVKSRITILDGEDVWIDPEAIQQLHAVVRSSLDNISQAVGMPDLHHGPTGVAILANRPIPKLPGYDIGCGMALFATRIPSSLSRDAVARRMARLDLDDGEDPTDPHLGTIGGGNHFAELLRVDESFPMSEEAREILDPRFAVLLVHSGSRGHGERVFAAHADGADPEGYMRDHMALVEWARRNRAAIARRFLAQFHGEDAGDEEAGGGGAAGGGRAGEALVDLAHNWIEALAGGGFLHRKGAAPARPGRLSLLPGSRETASYLLACPAGGADHLASLAHGAGRRLSRAAARRRRDPADATRGGTIVCGDRELLAEEAGAAYKDVDGVAAAMAARGMCCLAARLLPLATYKTRRPQGARPPPPAAPHEAGGAREGGGSGSE